MKFKSFEISSLFSVMSTCNESLFSADQLRDKFLVIPTP